ncbi:hypothetical protein ACFLZH_06145, partial [Patescibacteria group bacterium]
ECGNFILEGGESCDDGNIVNGDGCSASCIAETEKLTKPPPETEKLTKPPPETEKLTK